MLQLVFRDKITDTGGLIFIEVECFHRAHAVFVVINGFRLGRTEWAA
ncbi:hypothetical protein ALQ56_200411 [Pseudomonas syringae pv. papulans]|nr:hypothetical protein ALQ56_200411 [Pseudomonas syringae pv. papulans]